jgi:hypothetical protein
MARRRPHARWYGALYIYLVLWLAFWLAHFLLGWAAFVEEQAQHGQAAQWLPYLTQWGRDTAENNQSEMLQLLLQSGVNAALATTLFLAAEAQLTKVYVLLRWLVRQQGGDPTQIVREHDPALVDDAET